MAPVASALNWNDLRFFLAVHRGGSFAAAARALGCDHSTVGRRLGLMEAALALRVFDRLPDGVRLTEAGAQLIPLAEQVELTMIELQARATVDPEALHGTVALATSDIVATSFLLDGLLAWRRQHPRIRLEISIARSTVDMLRREADVAVRLTPVGVEPAHPTMVIRRLGTVGFAPYVARSRVPADDDAAALELDVVGLTAPERGFGGDWHAARGRAPSLTCETLLALRTAIAGGWGVGVLPCILAARDPTLRAVGPRVDTRDAWLVVHPELRRIPRVRALIDGVVAAFDEVAADLAGDPRVSA